MTTIEIHMYNKERMLVELLRNKNKLPFDYYKEILENYKQFCEKSTGISYKICSNLPLLPRLRGIELKIKTENTLVKT